MLLITALLIAAAASSHFSAKATCIPASCLPSVPPLSHSLCTCDCTRIMLPVALLVALCSVPPADVLGGVPVSAPITPPYNPGTLGRSWRLMKSTLQLSLLICLICLISIIQWIVNTVKHMINSIAGALAFFFIGSYIHMSKKS